VHNSYAYFIKKETADIYTVSGHAMPLVEFIIIWQMHFFNTVSLSNKREGY
jgi:hypothetical protein